MRKLVVVFCFLTFAGCKTGGNINEQILQTELEKLRLKADFKRLSKADAYSFINQYYLPRLDTLLNKRNIYIHPLKGRDFKWVFKRDSLEIVNKFASIVTGDAKAQTIVLPPPPIFMTPDKSITWDDKKLNNVRVITDYFLNTIKNRKQWTKYLGFGYIMVSYPQYNAHTKKLYIHDWIEDGSWCGTGKEHDIWFVKVPGGWRLQ